MNSEKFPRLRLLGAVCARHDGRDVGLGGDLDQRLLVALLAAKSEPLPRAAVIQWIWDKPGPDAVARYQELEDRLRARLANLGVSEALVAGRGLCRLEIPTDAVDLHRFRKLVSTARAGGDEHAVDLLQQALELFEGRPFGALGGERVENLRTTLLGERMSAHLEYAEVSLRLGRETRILPALAELNRAEPCHEKVAGLLMRAHYQNNDPNQAVAVFRRISKPGKELVALNRRIIQQDPALRPARRESRSGANKQARTETVAGGTGTKTAFGQGSRAIETAVILGGQVAPPNLPIPEGPTGAKNAIAGGMAFETLISDRYPE